MEKTPLGESIKTSCERCRRRKIKCDRKRPCFRCVKAGTECILNDTGEKQRPVSKSHILALEGQVLALEQVLKKLILADISERDDILTDLPVHLPYLQSKSSPKERGDKARQEIYAARLRAGQLRSPQDSNALQFFGGTSLFQIYLSKYSSNEDKGEANLGSEEKLTVAQTGSPSSGDALRQCHSSTIQSNLESGRLQYGPRDDTSQNLMAAFFKEQYPYHMVVYREYFLRDYDVGSGKYYSDFLLYAICALGALQYDDSSHLSDTFSTQAQKLLHDTFDRPELTSLQALVLLGYHEIAVGRASKGWLFCGLAFRLAHEMGLHLDPNNWSESSGSLRDREISRRIYWAAFIADKQLSLYFGRPPALYLNESDVKNTIRLQYPPDWQGLLDTYICKGASVTEYEDGVVLVGSFIYQAELSKIIHTMITDLFENRQGDVDPTIVVTKSQKIHASLIKWLSDLPNSLHWNRWTAGQVPAPVLHLHMFFHTVMIILHRPPSSIFSKEIAESEDVQICYNSLETLLRLMRSYSLHYRFRSLPLDFVHTLSTAASAVMMKRFLQGLSWTDLQIERSLSLILGAIDEIKNTWPCVVEIQECIVQGKEDQTSAPPQISLHSPDLMNGLGCEHGGDSTTGFSVDWDNDLSTLLTDEFLSSQLPVVEPSFQPFSLDDF